MLRINENEIDIDNYQYYLHNGELFTGVGCEYQDGELITETSYVNGLPDGITRGWYNSEQLSYEIPFRKGRVHGVSREWNEQGQLLKEETFEQGILTERKEWDNHGRLTNHWMIGESDLDYQRLQNYRAIQQQAA